MAYGSKLLSIDQLLAAWQNRNMQEGNRGQMAMQQKAAEQQIEAQKLANDKAKLEMDLLTSPFNIPRESWAGSGNANTPGLDKYVSDNQKMQKLSMLTGKNMPNQGISGYGGGRGEPAGPSDDENRLMGAQADLVEEQARMAQQKRQGVGSATADLLAQKQIEAELAGKTAESNAGIEEARIKEFGSGYDQLKRDAALDKKTGESKIAAGDKMIEKTKSVSKKEADKIMSETTGVQQKIYGNKLWPEVDTEIKSRILSELPAVIVNAKKSKISIDVNQLIADYINKYGKK